MREASFYMLFEELRPYLTMQTGNNLESLGSIPKNKKGALKTVKGDFVW